MNDASPSAPSEPAPSLPPQWAMHPVASLMRALEQQPAIGWVLKDVPQLRYIQVHGHVPMAQTALSPQDGVHVGQSDADHFEPAQASLLRLADLRAVRQSQAVVEVHRLETRDPDEEEAVRDWRVWRWVLGPPESPPQSLLVVWMDLGHAARQEQALAKATRQIQEQQLLITRMRAQLPLESTMSGAEQSLGWAAQRFAEQLRREVDLSQREQRNFTVLLVELEWPGSSDETQAALSALVAQLLSSGTRRMDTVAQIDARRFGVILSGAALTPAYARAESLRRRVAEHVATQAQDGAGPLGAEALRLSVGVAAFPHTASDGAALMSAAQEALAEARAQGGGCSVLARVPLADLKP